MTTKIEWTEETWNPIVGCDKVSEGCKNCYAINHAYRLMHMPGSKDKYAGTVQKTEGGKLNWTGKINLHEPSLIKPLKQKKPTMYFVNSMSDLFHEDVPFEFIWKVFGVMSVCDQHTFQILTKRPKRMLEFFGWRDRCDPDFQDDPAHKAYDLCVEYGIETGCGSAFETEHWPLPNVWLGVSVENQKTADERIPLLLQVPAAVRWLSMEPLLGGVDLNNIKMKENRPTNEFVKPLFTGDYHFWPLKGEYARGKFGYDCPKIDWVVVGGESGNGARPMHPDWVRSIRDQCKEAGVPFFFKQWGEWIPGDQIGWASYRRCLVKDKYQIKCSNSEINGMVFKDEHPWCVETLSDANPKTQIIDLRDISPFFKVGKRKAGRLLDGVLHNEYPEMKD